MEWKCDFSEVVVCDQNNKHVHNQTSDSKLLLSGLSGVRLRTAGAMVLACANPAIPSPWGPSIPTAPRDGRQRIVPTAVRWVCPMWPATKIAWIPWTMHWPFSEDGRLLGGWGRFFFGWVGANHLVNPRPYGRYISSWWGLQTNLELEGPTLYMFLFFMWPNHNQKKRWEILGLKWYKYK